MRFFSRTRTIVYSGPTTGRKRHCGKVREQAVAGFLGTNLALIQRRDCLPGKAAAIGLIAGFCRTGICCFRHSGEVSFIEQLRYAGGLGQPEATAVGGGLAAAARLGCAVAGAHVPVALAAQGIEELGHMRGIFRRANNAGDALFVRED